MMTIDLPQLGIEAGGAGILGALTGFAAKKLAKIIAFLIGLELVLFKFLESRGVLIVNWDKLSGTASEASTMATTQVPPSWMMSLLSTLSVGGGFSLGFLVGFKKG